MRNCVCILIFILSFSISSYAQSYKNITEAVTLVEQRSIYLNGGVRAETVGGKSRITIPVDLPKNTSKWFYSFSTIEGKSGVKNLNLAIQLSSLLIDQSGSTAKILSEVEIPEGSASADIYLLRSNNEQAFREKWDNNGGNFYFVQEGSTMNTKQAIVQVDDITSGRVFIGLKNPSELNGLNVFIEVVAIVQKEVYVDEWTVENMAILRSNCLKRFKTNGDGKNEVCNCLSKKITAEYTPSQYSNVSENSKESLLTSLFDTCHESTNNLALRDAERRYMEEQARKKVDFKRRIEEISGLIKESRATSELGEYQQAQIILDSAVRKINTQSDVKSKLGSKKTANYYNTLAWWSLLIKDMESTGDYLKKGLAEDRDNMYLRGNLGLYHLLNNNYAEAKKTFLYYRRKERLPDGRKWVDIIEEDLELFESKGMSNGDFSKIRSLLKIK